MTRPPASRIAAMLLLVLIASTAIGARLTHRDKQTVYHVDGPPAGWQATVSRGADLAFEHDALPVAILVNSECQVEMDVPLGVLTNHLLIDITHREVTRRRDVVIDGRTARATVIDGQLDGVPIRLDLRVVKIDTCVYDLIYIAPPDHFDKARADFETVVASFHAERTPPDRLEKE